MTLSPFPSMVPFHHRPQQALIITAVVWFAMGVISWLAINGHTAAFDAAGLLFWRGPALVPTVSPEVYESVRDITALGGVLLRSIIVTIALTVLLFFRLKREAFVLGVTILTGWLANSTMKLLVSRPRPTIVPHLTEATGNSFPSGHAFNSAVVYLGIALMVSTLCTRSAPRICAITSAIITSLAVAWSRVWLGVHWPTDVIVGWLGGTGWAILAYALLFGPQNKKGHTPHEIKR